MRGFSPLLFFCCCACAVLLGGCASGEPGDPLFTLLSPAETGLRFQNDVPDSPQRNSLQYEYFYNGGGVAIGDVNGDELPDVFLTANLGSNKLYLNQGDLMFADATREAGLSFERDSTWNTGVTMADVNGDGHLDLYVCRSGNLSPEDRANLLFINQGDGTFVEKARSFGLDDRGYSTQAAFFDYDRDGDLDAYVIGHGAGFYGSVAHAEQQRPAEAGSSYVTDRLYENRGGTFVDVTREAGVGGRPSGYGLGVAIGDLNGDGWDDFYVANDFAEHDYLYYNNGDGTFSPSIQEATRHIPYSSMGVDVADYNNDRQLDLAVLDMAPSDHARRMMNHDPIGRQQFYLNVRRGLHYQYSYNTLQLNNGNGTFSDVAWMAGIAKTDWSWTPLMADFDNDGWKDLFVTNGIRRDILNRDFRARLDEQLPPATSGGPSRYARKKTVEVIREMPSKKIKNRLFHNQGGLAFEDRTEQWGLGRPSFSNGAAYGDLDNDGDLDLVVNNLDGPASLYRNNTYREKTGVRPQAHYLRVRLKLKGPGGNREALGAKVQIAHGDTTQLQQKYRTRGYQSAVEGEMHFGLGKTDTAEAVRVTWPDGTVQTRRAVPADQVVTFSRDASVDSTSADSTSADATHPDATGQALEEREAGTRSWFRQANETLGIRYEHKENRFNDFRQQPLLPHKMSQLGPDLAVGDIDGDGREDFFVGGARGSVGRLFRQGAESRFASASAQPWRQDRASEDLGSLFFDADGDDDLDLYVVSGGSSFRAQSPRLQDRLYLNDGTGTFRKSTGRLPEMRASGSCVVAADYDGDGDQDLFVGGRGEPGQYPLPSRSYLLENDGAGSFEDVTKEVAPGLAAPGMVTDALWTDATGDDAPELMLAGEWMPVMMFAYRQGQFRNITEQVGLTGTEGWWFSLAQADLDGDGDPDYLAGNNGTNFRYRASPEKPFHLFADDFDHNGSVDPILGYYQDETLYPLVLRDVLAQQLPRVKRQFSDHASYAESSLEDLFGETTLEEARAYTVKTFASSALLQGEGSTLKRRALPQQAQLSSVNGFVTHDVDADGRLDVVLAGNLYGVEPHTPRNDASNGLVMKGTGTGRFAPLSIARSGFFAPGNVKAVEMVRTARGPVVLVANNDGPLQAFLGRASNGSDD